jgi:hypothetical protein
LYQDFQALHRLGAISTRVVRDWDHGNNMEEQTGRASESRLFRRPLLELNRHSLHATHFHNRQAMASSNFAQHAVYVISHSLIRQSELHCNLLISKAARNQPYHLLLSIGQTELAQHLEIRDLVLPSNKLK